GFVAVQSVQIFFVQKNNKEGKYMLTKARSQIEERIYLILREKFPGFVIVQNKTIDVGPKKLYADIYIENPIRMVIEVSPVQHRKMNEFFYKDHEAFWNAQRNDKLKKEWASKNDFTFIELTEVHFKDIEQSVVEIVNEHLKGE
ncbi:unnamed protein product, partial [marine sediment metagenome]